MKREFLKTGDGSITIRLPDWDEQYHSKHGAIAEAQHVFLNAGFYHFLNKNPNVEGPLQILEIGFGTGLNALLTLKAATNTNTHVHYVGMEAYPVALSEANQLNYATQLNIPEPTFLQLHEVPWEQKATIKPTFTLEKREASFDQLTDVSKYHLIYYDAFGPRVQPELWESQLLEKMYRALLPKGVWVTYCAKGSVRRSLQEIGFTVERLPGPPGKREMLRATKG